ncbi:hypothetical protein PEC301653_28530 [Pectobacterium carotovorum subsp. carotovorum]|nr:hypothetical protein PEC301653_28530 [Pectobacterium carotovorum subsp. carotovorum]
MGRVFDRSQHTCNLKYDECNKFFDNISLLMHDSPLRAAALRGFLILQG